MSIKLTSFVVCGLAALPTVVAATENNDIETVYVSATRSETAQLPVATQITVISAEEIRVSGAKLLSEVLRTQASIQITDSDGSGGRNVTASMRGLSGANNVLVLVDGRKLNNPSMAAPALNTIALKDVERIEIVQGSAGVLYGDQAIGGVINIITRRAEAGEVHGTLGATSGSFDVEDYTASVNQGFVNGLSYRVSAQKRNADNYRENNQNAYQNLLGNVRYDFSKGFVFAEGQGVDDELRLPGAISDADALIDPRQTYNPNDYDNQYTDTWRIGAGVNVAESWKMEAEYSDRNEEKTYFLYGGLTDASIRVKSFTPRVIGNFTVPNGLSVVTLGYDKIDSDYESNNLYSPNNSTQEQNSYYAQLVYPVMNQVTATLGSRYAQVDDNNHLKHLHQKDSLNASEFGLNYQMTTEWRIFSRYAQSFRFANPDDNNILPSDLVFLDPQTSESYELGVEWSGNNGHVSYSVYDMALNDEIVFNSVNFVNVNLPDSERQGFMLDANAILSEQLSVRLNYNYTDAEIVSGINKGKTVPFVASHVLTTGILLSPFKDVSVNFDALYTGKRFQADDEFNTAPKLDAFVILNTGITYTWKAVELSGRIKNITNEQYAGYHSIYGQYPQPGRNYDVSISYSF